MTMMRVDYRRDHCSDSVEFIWANYGWGANKLTSEIFCEFSNAPAFCIDPVHYKWPIVLQDFHSHSEIQWEILKLVIWGNSRRNKQSQNCRLRIRQREWGCIWYLPPKLLSVDAGRMSDFCFARLPLKSPRIWPSRRQASMKSFVPSAVSPNPMRGFWTCSNWSGKTTLRKRRAAAFWQKSERPVQENRRKNEGDLKYMCSLLYGSFWKYMLIAFAQFPRPKLSNLS